VIEGKRVVAWTPYGRRETVSILFAYMWREHERGLVDEWWLCMNTDPGQQAADVAYAYKLAARHGDFVKIVDRPADIPRLHPKQRNTGYFYRYMTDRDSVFLRLDDDIIYVHPEAVERLVRHRIETQVGVCSFPVMWNNSIVSWFLQKAGVIPEGQLDSGEFWPTVGGPYCMDPVGWANGQFAVQMHRFLLEHIEAGTTDKCLLYQDYQVQLGQQFSVSVFTSLGSMYADLQQPGVLVPSEEESWHTIHQPTRIGQPNTLVGDALVSHYTFFPQGPIVRSTDILDHYRRIAGTIFQEA
jgi:hypothetical protein